MCVNLCGIFSLNVFFNNFFFPKVVCQSHGSKIPIVCVCVCVCIFNFSQWHSKDVINQTAYHIDDWLNSTNTHWTGPVFCYILTVFIRICCFFSVILSTFCVCCLFFLCLFVFYLDALMFFFSSVFNHFAKYTNSPTCVWYVCVCMCALFAKEYWILNMKGLYLMNVWYGM